MSTAELSLQAEADQASGCEKSGCCNTTDDGSAICVVPQHEPQVQPWMIGSEPAETRWQQVRGGVMFAIACITSPCCTPLIVPVGLALLAGTPVAIWAGQNLGLVYGGLTLISVLSLFLGWRWLNSSRQSHQQITIAG